jgi:hypothetical protein
VSELANADELEEEPASVDQREIQQEVQQASANDCRGDGDGGNTSFSFEQDQSNRCSGYAYCSNYGEIEYGEE